MFKSIKTGVLALIMVSTAIVAHAQKKISEGAIVYNMELGGTSIETKVKFKDHMSAMHMQQGPAAIVIYTDNNASTGLITVDVPIAQKQLAAKMSKKDYEDEKAAQGTFSNFKSTGEKQTIAGYNAEKYTYTDTKGGNFELWVTTELDLPYNNITSSFKEVKGTPLKFGGSGSFITVKSIKEEKVGDMTVTKIPDGYEELTYADMKSMGGGQ